MGLDMYLRAERYVWYTEEELAQNLTEQFPDLPQGVKIKSVEAEVGYWRKANAVHKWFVDNVQEGKDECQRSFVSREQLGELKKLCERVLESPDLAASLLPTASGFFFGGTDYGEFYLQDIRETVEICDRALALDRGQWDLYYQASW